ncbi:hypothetical protein BDV98DRAFT_295789 [Pterulicium gracile]|uniref:DUF6534 domain-containing protein n=1 Tax=Pterulicium gracile TaxID=1884261 RepID=A0A5C3QU26_9AGAR|nr:hypothetical protein BDV98DRAFT_295789 [Pterula gracilis]
MVDHAQPSENLDLPMIINPFILGFMLSFALFGVFVAQCFFYYHSFRKDPLWTKIYVGGIMLLETAAIVLSVIAAWHIVGVMTFDRHSASLVAWATLLTLPLSGTLTSLVHGFYAWRIYRLTDTRLVPCIVGMISLAQLGMTIELIVQLEGPSFNLLHVKPNFAIVVVWLSGAAGADILITIRMVVFLMKTRRACNFDYTESLMQQLIRVFVETGLTTTFAVITALILYVARHETNLYLIPIYMLTGLYCNSLMATLNSRAVLGVGRINYPQNRLSRILPMTGGHEDGPAAPAILGHSPRDSSSGKTDRISTS